MSIQETALAHLRVHDVMHTGILTTDPSTPLRVVARLMTEQRVHAVAVADPDYARRPWAIVTTLDVAAAAAGGRGRYGRPDGGRQGDRDRLVGRWAGVRRRGDGRAQRRASDRDRPRDRSSGGHPVVPGRRGSLRRLLIHRTPTSVDGGFAAAAPAAVGDRGRVHDHICIASDRLFSMRLEPESEGASLTLHLWTAQPSGIKGTSEAPSPGSDSLSSRSTTGATHTPKAMPRSRSRGVSERVRRARVRGPRDRPPDPRRPWRARPPLIRVAGTG